MESESNGKTADTAPSKVPKKTVNPRKRAAPKKASKRAPSPDEDEIDFYSLIKDEERPHEAKPKRVKREVP